MRATRLPLTIVLLILLGSLPVVQADPIPRGLEFRINSSYTGQSNVIASDVDEAGNYVIVWASQAATNLPDVYVRRFGANGEPSGLEAQVNSTLPGSFGAAVALRPDGGFLVIWAFAGPADEAVRGIAGRFYDSQGSPTSDEIIFYSFGPGLPSAIGRPTQPRILMDSNGDFVIIWIMYTSYLDAYAQRFDSSGTPLGTYFQLNVDYAIGVNIHADMDSVGNWIVTWVNSEVNVPSTNPPSYVYARLFNAEGTARTEEVRVSDDPQEFVEHPKIATAADGQFVVVWSALRQGTRNDVYGQLFDADGNRRGVQFRVNTFWEGEQVAPMVAMDSAGNFVVVWVNYPVAMSSSYDIRGQWFDNLGIPNGSEFIVSSNNGSPSEPIVEQPTENTAMFAFNRRTARGTEVFGRLFDLTNTRPPIRNFYTTPVVNLSWLPVDSISQYHIQVDNQSSFASPEVSIANLPASPAFETPPLPPGQYSWRVRAQRLNGTWTNWSAVDTFVIGAP